MTVEARKPTVAVTADRRRDEQAVLLERHGLDVVLYPLLQTNAAGPDELRRLTEDLVRVPPDYLVANTGFGMRSWFAMASRDGVLDDLVAALAGRTCIVARGAKALGELRKAGLQAAFRAPSEVMEEVVAHLLAAGVARRSVAVQLHGEDAGAELARLVSAGAELRLLPVYRMATTGDGAAPSLVAAIAGGDLDAVTFTAAPQVAALAQAAREAGRTAEILQRFNESPLVAACIGHVCAGAAREHGIRDPLVPEHPRLGSLATAVAARLLGQV